MIKAILSLLLLSLTGFAASPQNCQHDSKTFRCVKYLKNYDGDTVTFEIPGVHPLLGKKISIRVAGVDTPEVRTKDKCEKAKARTAKRLVSNELKNAKSIELRNVSRGKYFRIVAEIHYDGKNLKDILIKNDLAYLYDGGKKLTVNWCASPKRSHASE